MKLWQAGRLQTSKCSFFSGNFALPFGKGMTHLSNANGFTATILGNWNVSWIATLKYRPLYSIPGRTYLRTSAEAASTLKT
jgi:hypothetical protein